MSKPPRQIGSDGNTIRQEPDTVGSNINTVIEKVREMNDESNRANKDIKNTAKDISEIADIMKSYVSGNKKQSSSETPGVGATNKICKLYGCIYKGTYDGIIDGLKKVAFDEQEAQVKKERLTATKVLSSTVKVTAKAPKEITKALVNLFAWERSEMLNLFRTIYHGVGYGKDGQIDYSQKAFRMMLNQEHDRKKLLKKGNVFTQNEQMLESLEGIRVAVDGGERTSGFGLFKSQGMTQIQLLEKIASGVGAQNRGITMWWQNLKPNFMRNMAVYQIQLLKDIKTESEESNLAYRGGVFGFGKNIDSQITLLRDIRDLLDPNKVDMSKTWKNMNIPISELIGKGIVKPFSMMGSAIGNIFSKKKKPDPKAPINVTMENVLLELEHNTDYQEDILLELNRHGALNRMRASDGRSMLARIDKGITVVPYNANKFSIYEADSLGYLESIETANIDEFEAIGKLGDSLCKCLSVKTNNNSMGEMVDSLEMTRQSNIEDSMHLEENKRDAISRQSTLQDSVDNIYSVLVKQTENMPEEKGTKGLLSKLGVVGTALDVAADFDQAKGLLLAEDVKWDNKQVVSLSNVTMKRFRKYFERYGDDDGPLDDLGRNKKKRGRSRRGRKSRLKRLKPPPIPKNYISKGKGMFKNIFSGAKNILSKIPAKDIAVKGKGLVTSLSKGVIVKGLLAGAGGAVLSDMIMPSEAGVGEDEIMRKINAEMAKKNSIIPDRVMNPALSAINDAKAIVQDLATSPGVPMSFMNGTMSVAEMKNVLGERGISISDALSKGTISIEKPIELTKETMTGIGTSIVGAFKEVDMRGWQESAGAGWTNTVKKMGELASGSETLKAIQESQTAGALQQVFNDGRTMVTGGGGGSTNITVPVNPHDSDRATNLLVASLGS